jgi:hypothetical protein
MGGSAQTESGRACAIWTARISYGGPNRLDVTRKGGSMFGPSWPLLTAARGRRISWATYVDRYTAEMRRMYAKHRYLWAELLERPAVVLCCYCRDPKQCHRTVLAELLVRAGRKEGLPAMYCGETRG